MNPNMKLGGELAARLEDLAVDHLADVMLTGWQAVSLDAGRELGLLDDETLAFRHLATGEVWTVQVEVSCQPVTQPGGTS